jgi:hypothetical protein
MKISQQTWNDLLMTPNIQSVTQMKYTDNGVCVCVENRLFFLNIYYLEWLNELAHFVVNGSYDKFFNENLNLRDFINKNHDDSQWIEIMDKLNHDQELVRNEYINF